MLLAIGDIHGCVDELRLLVNKLPISGNTTVVFLGDYIDRGPSSREVIETVLELSRHCRVITLMGNHERMLLDYLADPTSAAAGAFIYNGGSATLASYADASGEVTIPQHHRSFLRDLELFHVVDDYVFVHAGLPQIPIDEIDPERDGHAMLWMRGRFLTTDYRWDKLVVHAHTPVPRPDVRPNRINIDTGCVFDCRLSAVALPGPQFISVHRTVAPGGRIVLRDPSARRAAHRFRGTIPVQVRHNDRLVAFETIDYSEFGMYLRAVDESDPVRFEVGDRIEGLVGSDEQSRVTFAGVIVRSLRDDVGIHYGVKLLDTSPARDGVPATTSSRGPSLP